MNGKDNSFLNQCKKNLINTSAKNNNLINFNFQAATCFDFNKFSKSEKNRKNSLIEIDKTDRNNSTDDLSEKEKLHREAHKVLGKIYVKQKEIKDEKGFNPTNWACSFFKYKDGDKERFAPVYLVSAEVSKNGLGGYAVNDFRKGIVEVSFNHVIYEKFKNDLKVNLEKNLTDFDDSEVNIKDVEQKILKIQSFLADNVHVHGITIEKGYVLGIFNNAKASLYNELNELEDQFLQHDLVKIFLSNESHELNQGELSEDAREIDKIQSDNFFSPFDFDSSQLQAIKAAKDGKNFVIQGPPGTGKTQTISNIISELVAEGKKVLFVAEKKAAIDAVLKNFSKIGLEKVFLDLHDKKSKSKDIVSQVIDSIEFFSNEKSINRSSIKILSKLDQAKKELSKRTELLHQELSFGKKPFDLFFELSEMTDVDNIEGNFFVQLSEEDFNECLNILDQIKELPDIYLDSENPFLNSDLSRMNIFLENNKGQKYLSNLKTLILETKSKTLKLIEAENRIAKSEQILGNYGLHIQKFEKYDELQLVLFKEALPYKDLLENNDNPWLKKPINNPELFDTAKAKNALEEIRELLIEKIAKEEELNLLQSTIYDLEEGFKQFSFIKDENFKLKNSINIFGKIRDYQDIIKNYNQKWFHVRFKDNCFENGDFLEDLVKKLDLLITNTNLLSDLEFELGNLNKHNCRLNFYRLLNNLIRKVKIVANINKTKSRISSLKEWILFHLELNDNSNFLDDISFLKDGLIFISQNKDILNFKALQNKIKEEELDDFFWDTIKKGADFDYEKQILESLYVKRLSLGKIQDLLAPLDKDLETSKRNIKDSLFDIVDQDQNLKSDIELRIKYIETTSSIITAQNLIKEIEQKVHLLGITEFWQSVWSIKCNLNQIKLDIQEYFSNKSLAELLNSEVFDNNNNIELRLDFIFGCLESESHTLEDLNFLEEKVNFYTKYLPVLHRSVRYLELKDNLDNFSLKEFWNNVVKNKISQRKIEKVFRKSFYSYILQNLIIKNELISDTKATSEIINDFKSFDKHSIQINKKRIIESIKKNSSKIVADYDFLKLKNRQRFPKARKLISKYHDIIVNSVGCVVCSPLTICEYFEVNRFDFRNPIFDVVIFDEASQIFTWDALSSIFRAKQMIIAGDTQQMPPTNLFASNDNGDDFDENDEDTENVNDYRGLLSFAAMRLREIQLQWHYRSKFEQLIHPSNQFVYNGRLISFPNSDNNEKPIVFHYLPEGMWVDQTNDVEANYLINLLKNTYKTGVKSVGVISINKRQRTLIRDLIYCDEELTEWLDRDDSDGLFVKNLENCQGDERDVIIVCSSYAKNKDGRIDGRMFGQMNKDDSYKRLNVMFSRAKERLHFLSSLKWQDISSQYEGKKGMDFFKSYLRFAETGDFGITSKNHVKQDSFDSGFEESVCKSLRLLGYEIDSQVGCSGYKIDLAVVCQNTKNYILGIECDGEMYHSGKTARERDRLRQEVLESKGWNIHRIWSYDWIYSKKKELKKLKSKIDTLIT